VFDVLRSDLLAACRDDQFFLAINDAQEAISIERANIPCVEPAVRVKRFRRRLRIVVVAKEEARTTQQYLTVLGDTDL
jgi:hypothetical protein